MSTLRRSRYQLPDRRRTSGLGHATPSLVLAGRPGGIHRTSPVPHREITPKGAPVVAAKWPSAAHDSGYTRPAGQAIIEFALASLVFLMVVFGTIDFGRAIFVSAELRNAAREGARYGKIRPTDTGAIRTETLKYAVGTGLTSGGVAVSCTGSCTADDKVTVSVSVSFQAITQNLLGIGPLTLTSSSTARIE